MRDTLGGVIATSDAPTILAEAPPDRCCGAAEGGVMPQPDAERLASSLRAVADPTRLRLLSLVAARPDGEACVCEMTDPVGLTQGTVSHHLKILVDAGLLTRERRGKWVYFALVPDALTSLGRLVGTLGTLLPPRGEGSA